MKKIKCLLFMLLVIVLTGCSPIQMKFGHKVEQFGHDGLPKIVIGVKDTELLYDKDCVQFDFYYGFNYDFTKDENEDTEFVGVLLLTCSDDDAKSEFSKTQTDWNYIENKQHKVEGVKISREECLDKNMRVTVQGNGDILYPYFRPAFLPEKLITDKTGLFTIQMREVLYSKSGQYYYTSEKVSITIQYKVSIGDKIVLSMRSYQRQGE